MGILKGKIIKKTDEKSIKKLEIQNYPWLSFQEKNIVFPDNPRKSVILQKYHDPKEIQDKVTEAGLFSQQLQKKSTPLYPTDLTEDYERGLREVVKRRRRRLMGEEEAMALELAEIDATQSSQFQTKLSSKFQPKSASAPEEKKSAPVADVVEEKKTESALNLKPDVMSAGIPPEVSHIQAEAKEQENSPEQNDLSPSKMPIEESLEWQDKMQEGYAKGEAQGIEQGMKQGYEKGYLEGFQSGEERAMKAQESKYEIVFKNVAGVVEQIEKLKNSLYAESKDIFVEIIKLCAEKILRQQVKYSDVSLFALFDEVTKSISQQSTMKVELNAQDLVRMKNHIEKLGIQDRVTLREDNTKSSGDFTVESERGISIANLHQTVENVIDKLKVELFSEGEDTADKAS